MGQILLMDESARMALRELRAYAEKNPYSMDELFDIMNGALQPPGLDPHFQRLIPVNHKVVFAHESHPVGLCRHCSVSVTNNGKTNPPSMPALADILEELGFDIPIEKSEIWLEDLESGQAINIVQPIKK